ncbi:MAG: HAD family phosphatase [Roseburia sp.]|nr:HAD family phosphatase [Roseburia sp.]MCM1097682.1 HAD family phosphatase [Ruminococcus flavefaciens]
MIQAVIFDMDGTLIDTEKYYRVFWPKAMAEFGYHMTDEQALTMRSLGRPFAPRQLKEWFGEEVDYDAVRQRRKELMAACLEREGIERKPGALELLRKLKERGVVTAVATATDPERTADYLRRAGLEGYFDRIISATQVAEGKPSPDIYLDTCRRLGLPPENCMAVEDSPNGVLSAWRAGCRVVMVPDQTEPDEELGKCLFARADSLAEIEELLERISE